MARDPGALLIQGPDGLAGNPVPTKILTLSTDAFPSNTTNSTTAGTSIANPAPTTTEPTGTGVIAMVDSATNISANGLLLIPYGTDTDDQTFLMSVFAWDRTDGSVGTKLWVAWPLATFSCRLSALTGVAASDIDNTNLFCDAITLVEGNANISNEIISPSVVDVMASVLLDCKGARKVEIRFARNASAASMNCLVRRL